MCVPGCQETVRERLTRRNFLRGAVAAAAAAAMPAAAFAKGREPTGGAIHQVVDLTHTLDELFPTYSG